MKIKQPPMSQRKNQNGKSKKGLETKENRKTTYQNLGMLQKVLKGKFVVIKLY